MVAFAAMIDGDGEVTDFLRLPNLMKRKDDIDEERRELKVYMFSLFSCTLSIHYCVCVIACGQGRHIVIQAFMFVGKERVRSICTGIKIC